MTISSRLSGYLAVICMAFLLASCDTGSGGGTDVGNDQTALLTCTNDQIPDASGTQCVDKPLQCPGGEVLDETGTMCEPAPFDGPDPIYFPAADEAVVYYNRQAIDQAYDNWVLHLWDANCGEGWADQVTADSTSPTSWPAGPSINGEVDPIYGNYWVLKITEGAPCGNFIVHDRSGEGSENQTPDIELKFDGDGRFARMAFVIAKSNMQNVETSTGIPTCIDNVCEAAQPPARPINGAAAHWIDAETLVWGLGGTAEAVYGSIDATLDQDEEGNITGGSMLAALVPTMLSEEQIARVPHLAGWDAYTLSEMTADAAKAAVKGQLLAIGTNGDGELVGTDVQTARLLDALYTFGENDADEATLGLVYEGDIPTVNVWAPTAQRVRIKLYNDANPKRLVQIEEMTEDSATGIWSYTGAANLDGNFYRIETTVFNGEDAIVSVEGIEPYSVSMGERGFYSQFANLNDPSTQPDGWGSVAAPPLMTPESMVIYEGHIRDFSILDESTSEANRGKYLGFTETGSLPMQHLQALKDAGLTHFHVLPFADFVTVDENRDGRVEITDTVERLCLAAPDAPVCGVEDDSATLISLLEGYDPTTDDAKNLVEALRSWDGFNWGYDPFNYNVPEGSYASDSDGTARILELRAMIQALNEMGLRVAMDVVYPHTSRSGLEDFFSTFDKMVPGYYYRRDPMSGEIEGASGAGPDTAPENRMFGKFITDSILHWQEHYGVNDFRFDQMTFIPKSVILETLAAAQANDPDTYFYGEGWPFGGSSADDAIFETSGQEQMAGTGVGTFNDEMREPMRQLRLIQGGNVDKIRAGLAGNLASYEFYNSVGQLVTADTVGAYNADPQEAVNYASKHDNETMWDMIQREGAVSTDLPASDRARIQNLTMAMPMLSQGVPFFHMGSDILRSKSMDRNTFDAGDWYNKVDFTKMSNNWAVGMPLDQGDQSSEWIQSQFMNPNTAASSEDIMLASGVFNEFLRISGSPLFSLGNLDDVQARVGFHNTGAAQVPGVIAMSIDDGTGLTDLDAEFDAVMVVYNGSGSAQDVSVRTASGFTLHPMQETSTDAVVQGASFSEEVVDEEGVDVTYGTFSVPAYTAAVYVKEQGGSQGVGMAADATIPLAGGELPNPYVKTTFLRGSMNDWGTTDPFTYNGDGTFDAYINLEADTTYFFKFASADWSTPNFGSTMADNQEVELDTNADMGSGDGLGNLSFEPAVTGEYRFTVTAFDPDAPSIRVSLAVGIPYANEIYVRGSFNDWGSALEDDFAFAERGIYRATVSLMTTVTPDPDDEEVPHMMKVANADWSTENFGGVDSDSADIAVDQSLVLFNGGASANIRLPIPEDGDYLFSLDANDSNSPTLHVVAADRLPASLFVRGGFNGWGTANPMTYLGDNIYQADILIESGTHNFKIATEDWATEFTAGSLVTLYDKLRVGAGENSAIVLTEDSNIRFRLDASLPGDPIMILTEEEPEP